MTYNLLMEHRVPVLMAHSPPRRVSIREALMEAARISKIAASDPLDRVAPLPAADGME